jgi:preprotein translocase subunit SecE
LLVNEYIKLLIWVAVIGAAFAVAWRKGYLKRLADYVAETREELKKCAWPSFEELRGSTVVVLVALGLLGLFTVGIDVVVGQLVNLTF